MHKSKAMVDTLMKRTMTIGLLGAILAVAVGFISTNAISATPFLIAGNQASPYESAYMIGHVEYTVRDANGQIKQYTQGDNLIVSSGTDCSAQLIFNSSDTSACTFNGDGFNFIGIGNDTAVSANNDALRVKTLLDDANSDGCTGGADTCEMDRTEGIVTIDTSGLSTIATIETETPFAFTSLGTTGTTVEQSGLFDVTTPSTGTASGNMFAMREGLGISVTNADTLTVTWKVTLAGS
jgi:hypothetical protein